MVNQENSFSDFENGLIHGKTNDISQQDQISLILKGLLFSIRQNPAPELIVLLGKAVLLNPYPEIGPLCILTLDELAGNGNSNAVQVLFSLAVENQNQTAALSLMGHPDWISESWQKCLFSLFFDPSSIVSQEKYIQSILVGYLQSPPPVRFRIMQAVSDLNLTHLLVIMSCLVNEDNLQMNAFWDAYPLFSTDEKDLVFQIISDKSQSPSSFLEDITCKLFTFFEEERALSLSSQNHWLPSIASDQAVYLFLSQQWDAYQKFDFNRSLLSTAFEKSPDSVRKRILQFSRQSGITDWLADLSAKNQDRWLTDFSNKEWTDTISFSCQNKLWEELWSLCQLAPVYWGIRILHELSNGSWLPGQGQEFFQKVRDLSAEIQLPLEINKQKVLYSAGKYIFSLAYNESLGWLAAGTKDQDILLWNIKEGAQSLPPLQSPVSLSRSIVFSSTGEHLAAANIDNAIRIYQLPEGKLIKTLTGHTNLIKSMLLHPNNRILYSTDFDGKIMAWRFPFGNLLNQIQACQGELYSLGLSVDGQVLFSSGACGHIHAWDLSNWKEIHKLGTGRDIITHMNMSVNNPQIIYYSPSQTLSTWNYETGKITTKMDLPKDTPLFTSINLLSSVQSLVVGANDGSLEIRSIENANILAAARVAGSQTTLTCMAASPDEQTLYTGTSDGKVYCWDLFPLSLALSPIKLLSSSQTEALPEKMKSSLLPQEKKCLELVQAFSQWQKRFDIQLTENRRISIGEFDIVI